MAGRAGKRAAAQSAAKGQSVKKTAVGQDDAAPPITLPTADRKSASVGHIKILYRRFTFEKMEEIFSDQADYRRLSMHRKKQCYIKLCDAIKFYDQAIGVKEEARLKALEKELNS